jgi:uncharacterized integral membrane protein
MEACGPVFHREITERSGGFKMDWKFVLALIFALIVAVFALQNAIAVDISFLTMEFSISQALVILISAAFGALVVLLLSLVRWIKFQSKLKSSAKTISALEQENKQLKMKLEAMESAAAKNDESEMTKNNGLTENESGDTMIPN